MKIYSKLFVLIVSISFIGINSILKSKDNNDAKNNPNIAATNNLKSETPIPNNSQTLNAPPLLEKTASGIADPNKLPNAHENKLVNELFLNAKQIIDVCKGVMDNLYFEIPETKRTGEPPAKDEVQVFDDSVFKLILPSVKVSKYDKLKLNEGPIVILFDYLDNMIFPIIKEELQQIFKKALEIPPSPLYLNPFEPKIKSQEAVKETPEEMEKKKFEKVKEHRVDINEDIYKRSVSASQLFTILTQWNWFIEIDIKQQVHKLMLMFDCDGDGRLNPKEFYTMLIYNNKSTFSTCKNCLNKSVIYTIDPIFDYLDCDLDNTLDSYEFWEGLKGIQKIKVNSFTLFNDEKIDPKTGFFGTDQLVSDEQGPTWSMYSCKVKGEFYWTNSITDFFIKATKIDLNKINKYQFRKYVLLTYVERLVGSNGANFESFNKAKDLRWPPDSTVDTLCPKL